MTAGSNVTTRLADWAADLQYENIPRRVVDECKNQILSVIASVHAGHFTEAGRTVSKKVKEWGGGRDATLIPSGEKVSAHNAIFGNAALSMALDYDDYLFAGHTGHSAVLCTLALAEKHGVSGKEFVTAQTAANELAGRLGAASLIGPLNGQLWSFVHLIGGAAAGAKVLGLDKTQTASAIGLALVQPCYPLAPGFFGSEGKILLAAQTAAAGVMAADLAAAGLKAAGDIIGHEQGFLKVFSHQPLLGAFEGLGSTWVSDTLCFKVHPGCAYLDTTLDCILHLVRTHNIDPKKVRAIRIAASPLTLAMEGMAEPYLAGPQSLPVTLNFSVKYSAAVALIDKEVTARQFLRERIKDPFVWDLASRVDLSLDEDMARRMRDNALVRMVPGQGGEQPHLDLGAADLVGFKMSFGARVRIEMEDGRTFEAEQEVPNGAAGRSADERRQAVEDKFRRETRYTLRKEKMERAIDLVQHIETAASSHLREIVRLCCSERS